MGVAAYCRYEGMGRGGDELAVGGGKEGEREKDGQTD